MRSIIDLSRSGRLPDFWMRRPTPNCSIRAALSNWSCPKGMTIWGTAAERLVFQITGESRRRTRNRRRTGWYRFEGIGEREGTNEMCHGSRLPPERECVLDTCSPPLVRMSPGAPRAYILHSEMAAALRRRKMSQLIPMGHISGMERLIGRGKDCQTRVGGIENRFSNFRKGRTNKKPHSLMRAVRFKN